jgi:hypothetical protein
MLMKKEKENKEERERKGQIYALGWLIKFHDSNA